MRDGGCEASPPAAEHVHAVLHALTPITFDPTLHTPLQAVWLRHTGLRETSKSSVAMAPNVQLNRQVLVLKGSWFESWES